MIVLRRKRHEQIVINGDITVTVMNIRGTRVSLGIEAPLGVRILRNELKPYESSSPSPTCDQDGVAHPAPPATP